jgi:hypothetical protein
METNLTCANQINNCMDVKPVWQTPTLSELDIKDTKSDSYYQDDGWGPGASLS